MPAHRDPATCLFRSVNARHEIGVTDDCFLPGVPHPLCGEGVLSAKGMPDCFHLNCILLMYYLLASCFGGISLAFIFTGGS